MQMHDEENNHRKVTHPMKRMMQKVINHYKGEDWKVLHDQPKDQILGNSMMG